MLTVQVVDASNNPVNGIVVQYQVCTVGGSNPCATYNSTTTETTATWTVNSVDQVGIAPIVVTRDSWQKVVVGAQTWTWYWSASEDYYYLRFTAP
jgi:hypothetical protein